MSERVLVTVESPADSGYTPGLPAAPATDAVALSPGREKTAFSLPEDPIRDERLPKATAEAPRRGTSATPASRIAAQEARTSPPLKDNVLVLSRVAANGWRRDPTRQIVWST